MATIVFVLLCISSLWLSFYADKKNKVIPFILSAVILIIISGFRDISVAIDTQHYYAMFDDMMKGHEVYINEKGFIWIFTNFLRIFPHPKYAIFVCSLLTISLFYRRFWELRKTHSLFFMCMVFVCMYFLRSMNIVRQFAAWAIVFWSLRFLEKKQYFIFGIIILVTAYCFHLSAVVGIAILFFYLIKDYKNSKKAKFLFWVFIAGFLISIKTILSYVLDSYDMYLFLGNFQIGFLDIYKYLCLFVAIFLEKMSYPKIKDKRFKFYCGMYFIAISLDFISYFGSYIGRVGLYFTSFEFLFWGYILKNKDYKSLLRIFGMVMFIYMAFQYVYFDGFGIFPYKFV